jgi:hypothetical protein
MTMKKATILSSLLLLLTLLCTQTIATAQDSTETTPSSGSTRGFAPRRTAGGFARETALGGGPGFLSGGIGSNYDFNPFLRNDAYMLVNPAYVNEYKNFVWGNFDGSQTGANSKTFAGANFELAPTFNAGIIVNTRDAQATSQTSPFINNGPGNIENTFAFLLGYKASPNLNFGLQVYTGSRRTETKTERSDTLAPQGTETNSLSTLGFDLGAVYDKNTTRIEVSGKLRMNSRSVKDEETRPSPTRSTETNIDGGMEIAAKARGYFAASPSLDIVPVLGFYTTSWKPQVVITPAPNPAPTNQQATEVSLTELEAGIGINKKLRNALLIGGISYVQASNETKITNRNNDSSLARTTTNKTTGLPRVNLGLEYYALDWLTVRLGYYKLMGAQETKQEDRNGSITTTVTNTSSGTTAPNRSFGDFVSVGVGMHFGSFNLNMNVQNEFLNNGPWFIGGNQTSNLFGQVSANYAF